MIWIDDREGGAAKGESRTGSINLARVFESHRTRPQVTIRRLPAGDIAFPGEGDKGPCMVGIERKRLKDLLSSKRTGRLVGEQLPKLMDQYEYRFLVIEDTYRTNWKTGNLEMPYGGKWHEVILGSSPFLAMELESFLLTLTMRTPIQIVHTTGPHGTVERVLSIQHYFETPLAKRHEHLALHVPQPAVTIGKASTVRRWAYALSGVGWERSLAVETRFRTPLDLAQAEMDEWKKLPGFGKVLAGRVFKEIRGECDQ